MRAACRDGRVESVELTNVPSFAAQLDATLEVEGVGTISVDVAFGGMWYAIADASALGFAIEPGEARELSRVGELIRRAAREQLRCAHPENADIAGVSIVQIAEPWQGIGARDEERRRHRAGQARPLGDGNGAVGAHGGPARARADAGRRRDDARVRDRLDVRRSHRLRDDRRWLDAIVPAIRGSAWITGVNELYVDDDDPFPEGYLLSDTWPGDDVQ